MVLCFLCCFLSYAHCILLLVFLLLTDVLLVMEAVATNQRPCSEEELQTVRSTRLVLQWMPSRCGIDGHEETCLAGCSRRTGRKQGHPHRDEDSQRVILILPESHSVLWNLWSRYTNTGYALICFHYNIRTQLMKDGEFETLLWQPTIS